MFSKQKISLVAAALASLAICGTAAAAGQGDTLLTVDATLTSGCAVSTAATISFGSFSTLAVADQTANSGDTFTVACSAGMVPLIFVTGTRTIMNAGNSLAFNLSLSAGAVANDLPVSGALATSLALTQDGSVQVVPLYARLAKANFGSLPAGVYANGSAVTVSVLY